METSRLTDRVTASRKAGLRAGLLFAGTALTALVLIGCEEDRLTKSAYEQKVRTEYATVQAAFESTRGTSGQDLAARLESAQTALREAAENLEAAGAPADVQKENEELVEGMRAYASQLEEVVEAAANGRQEAIDLFNEELGENEAVEQMAEAAEEMKFKGYDLGQIAEE